jgi:ATP-dependent RNA helicase DHX29
VDVSDLDSDLELDELVPTYLKIKGKLYEIDPSLVEATSRKQTKGSKSKKGSPNQPTQSPAVRKLLSQLQQITSDALFDERDAEALWPAKRNQIAQDRATQRQEQEGRSCTSDQDEKPATPVQKVELKPSPSIPVVDPVELDEEVEADILGGMFSAVPDDVAPRQVDDRDANSDNITLRDFGKSSGMTPRRLLEEAVRSRFVTLGSVLFHRLIVFRDPGARLMFKMTSPTTYSCRHALTISWSKSQEIEYDTDVPGVTTSIRNVQATYAATSIATVSVEQSESYIATAALFSISVAVPKEEKVYLRLPSNWRELYREFMDHRKIRIDAADRESVRHFRSIVLNQIEDDESDGVVLTSRFKMRNQAAVTSSTSNSGYNTPVREIEGLRDVWAHKQSTIAFQRMLVGRQNLPVYGYRESILSTIDKNQITIICGETGCGKSTQIPSFILEHELSQGKACKVFCTEPRRISAISLAQRVSEELGEGPKDLGTMRSLVGYAIRLESKTSSQTRLVYATVGVVLRMLESAGGLPEVTHLVIDEVHERRYVRNSELKHNTD